MNEKHSEFKLDVSSKWTDPISALAFDPNSARSLLVSSWDCTLRVFDVSGKCQRHSYQASCPLLDCCYVDSYTAYSAGTDGHVRCTDLNTGSERVFPAGHDAPVRCLSHVGPDPDAVHAGVNVVCSGSWDRSVKAWDVRMLNPVQTIPQPDKVYSMSSCGDKLIVATAARHVLVWDLRAMTSPLQRRESSLKYQTRCVRAFPDKTGFVLSSIEGRVAVECMDPNPDAQKKKYAFKCHRIKEDGSELVYPVNAIAFHRQHGTFATGGSDGYVNIWDGANKKRLVQYHRFPTGVTSLAFSHDGQALAIGCSYLNESGEKMNPLENAVYIRNVAENEVRPK